MQIKHTFNKLRDKTERTKIIAFITMIYNFIWSIVKIVIGIFTGALFFCINGIYTLLIGFTKRIFLNHYKSDNEKQKASKSLLIGILIIIIGTLFTIYMARLFFINHTYNTNLIVAIVIATFAFVDLGISIYNITTERKQNDILLSTFRKCNLISSFYAIVLTQVALLSVTNSFNYSMYNGITGVIFGFLSILIGIYIIFKAKINLNKNI